MNTRSILVVGPGLCHSTTSAFLKGLAVRATSAVVDAPGKDQPVTCRDAGVELVMAADQKWEVDVPTKFQWMPGGVSLVTPSYGGRTIRMAVRCDQNTAKAVQASFDKWRKSMPKQRPFGCVEHREQEAAFLPTHFEWDAERDGVACCGTPTALGAQNVNGRIHRSWSPTFTTDADYGACRCSDCGLGWDGCDAARCEGVMEFPDGVRGSLQNPAEVTGVAFSVGSLTNKPAFRNIDPVRARDGSVKATWSDAARKAALEARRKKSKFEPDADDKEAHEAIEHAKDASWVAKRSGGSEAHSYAAHAHRQAERLLRRDADKFGDEFRHEMADVHARAARRHRTASDDKTHIEARKHLDNADDRNPDKAQREASEKWLRDNKVVDKEGLIIDPDVEEWWNINRARDGSVKATWSDAARQAAAEARRLKEIHTNHLPEEEVPAGDIKPGDKVDFGSGHRMILHVSPKKKENRGTKENPIWVHVHEFTTEKGIISAPANSTHTTKRSKANVSASDPGVQTSDAILAKLAQSQPPVRARTSDEILGVVKARVRATELETTGAVRAAFGAFAPGHPFHGNQYSGEAETLEDAMFASNQASKASGKAHMSGGKAEHHATAAEEHDNAAEAHDRAAGLSNTGSREAKLHMMQKTMHENMAMAHRHAAELARTHSDLVKATDPTVKAHCKDNLYADVPDATEAEAAAYDRLVDGGSSHQVAVAELRKKRNPADATVQTSDEILSRLAGEPVRATWSDAAREASAAARAAGAHAATNPSVKNRQRAAMFHSTAADAHSEAENHAINESQKSFHKAMAKSHRMHASNYDRMDEEKTKASDAILAKLAQEQPPVRARTSDEILGVVKASGTSEGARKGWESRTLHTLHIDSGEDAQVGVRKLSQVSFKEQEAAEDAAKYAAGFLGKDVHVKKAGKQLYKTDLKNMV